MKRQLDSFLLWQWLMLLAGFLLIVAVVLTVGRVSAHKVSGEPAALTLTLDFSDEAAKSDYLTAYAQAYGWSAQIPDPAEPLKLIANPQSAEEFTVWHLQNHFWSVVKARLVNKARDDAQKSSELDFETKKPDRPTPKGKP